MAIQQAAEQKNNACFSLCACPCAAMLCYPSKCGCSSNTWISHSSQTVSLNSNKSCSWGHRRIADTHWEPAFLLVLEFPLLTGLQQSSGETQLGALLVCVSGPLWALMVLRVPLVFVPGWDKGLMSAAVAPNTEESHRGPVEGVESTGGGGDCTDMEAVSLNIFTISFSLCFSATPTPSLLL